VPRGDRAIHVRTRWHSDLGGKGDEGWPCFVRIAQIDPDNRDRILAVARRLSGWEMPRRPRADTCARTTHHGNEAEALGYFEHAHKLRRTIAARRSYTRQGLLRNGDAAGAAASPVALAETERDVNFWETYADA